MYSFSCLQLKGIRRDRAETHKNICFPHVTIDLNPRYKPVVIMEGARTHLRRACRIEQRFVPTFSMSPDQLLKEGQGMVDPLGCFHEPPSLKSAVRQERGTVCRRDELEWRHLFRDRRIEPRFRWAL